MPKKAKLPTPQDLNNLARALAIRLAYNKDDIPDLIQEALYVAYRDLRVVRNPRMPFGFVRNCMCRAIADYNRKQKRYNQRNEVVEVDNSHYEHIQQPRTRPNHEEERVLDRLDLEQYFATIGALYGPQARQLAINIVSPTDTKFQKYMVINRKRHGRYQRVPLEQLRQLLELSRDEWRKTMANIRSFTAQWLEWNTRWNTSDNGDHPTA